MEVEATSLGHAAFAPLDYETPQAPSPSPLNSPWPELETHLDQPEEGAPHHEQQQSLTSQSRQDGNQEGEEVAQQNQRHDAQYAVPPASGHQTVAQNSQPNVSSHPLPEPAKIPPNPPTKPVSLAQSLFPEDFEDQVEEESEAPAAAGQADQVLSEGLPQTQTPPEQQTQSPTHEQQPKSLEQSVLDNQDQPYPIALHESLDPLDHPVDPLDQSQPFQPQTPTKDYSELATAVADLNLPTNSLFPADLALASYEAEEAAPVQDIVQNDPMQAFAKLQFPDGDFYVNTYAVELGRDLNAAKFERKAGRKQHKMKLNRDVQMEQDADMNLDEDGHHVAPRSNVSETGGIVGVNIDYDSEEAADEAKRRKRKQFRSTNSSHSVDPTSLLTNPYDLSLDWQPQQDKPFEYECPFIPIHPQAGQSFRNISRKHIRIEYNLQKAHWEMLVKGRNGVFHDDTHVDKDALVKLHHGSEILIQGITIIFKLPDNARNEEEEEEPAHILSETDSSLSDLDSVDSVAFAHDDEDVDLLSEDEPLRLKRPVHKKERPSRIVKLKLTLKKNFPAVAGSPVEKEDKKEKEKEKKKEKEKIKEREREKESEKEKMAEKAKIKEKDKEKDKVKDKDKEKEKERRPSKSGKQSIKPDKPARAETAEKMPRTPKVDKVEKPVPKLDLPDKPVASDKIEKPKHIETAEKNIITPKQPEVVEQTFEDRRESAVSTIEMPPPSQPADIKQSVEPDSYEALQALQVTPSQTPPTVPADLPPGSILAGLAPEEIPQKRKGPGRPPKNGVMSKRDEAIIKRKTKELQKMGKIVPPLAELLALARAEGASTTKKDSKPEDTHEGEGLSQSVEIDPALMAIQEHNNATPSAEVKTEGGMPAAQPTPDKDANEPKRIVKSPSPQKPESEYTEEELKKPTQTYVVLIHEALSKAPSGIMDLQQIYDAMQKMYPWFKYRSTTQGWQSSVRHNLISSEAFEEAGKIGKGRLWKINPNVSIDKEKKRKAPTPPPDNRPQQQQQYPYYPNNQYPYGHPGAPAYGAYARPSPYGTPYGPPTVQNVARPPVPTPQQKPGTYYSPYASTTPGAAAASSPYGPPSRAPYAPYPQPPRPPGNAYGQPPQPPQSQPGQPQAPTQQGQATPGQAPPPPQGQPQQPPAQPGQGPRPQYGQPNQSMGNQASGQPNGQPPYAAQGQQPPRPVMAPGPAPGQVPPPQNQSGITSEKMIDNIMDYHKRYLSNFQGPEQEKHRAIFRKATNRHIHRGQDHGPFESEEEEKLYKAIHDIISTTHAETASAAPAQPQANGMQGGQTQGQAQPGAAQNAVGTSPQAQGTPGQHPPTPGQGPPPAPQQQMANGQGQQSAMGPQHASGPHPIQQTTGSSSEQALAEALKTAMPSAQAFRQGAPIASYYPAQTHQGIAPRPSPYAQPQAPQQQQRMRPPPGQQQVPQARAYNVAAPAPQPQAPRPTFTAPSQPQSGVATPTPQTQAPIPVAPRPVAPAPSQTAQQSPAPASATQSVTGSASHVSPAIQPAPTSTPSQPPAPVFQPAATPAPQAPAQIPQNQQKAATSGPTADTPAPMARQQAPTSGPAVQQQAPAARPAAATPAPQAVQAPAALKPSSIIAPASTPTPALKAPTSPADPNAHGGLKRPIEIDGDGEHEAKKQRMDDQA